MFFSYDFSGASSIDGSGGHDHQVGYAQMVVGYNKASFFAPHCCWETRLDIPVPIAKGAFLGSALGQVTKQ